MLPETFVQCEKQHWNIGTTVTFHIEKKNGLNPVRALVTLGLRNCGFGELNPGTSFAELSAGEVIRAR